jgi:hypothetical protein
MHVWNGSISHKPAVRRVCPLCLGTSEINMFCYCQSVNNFDAVISDRAFDLGVATQKLDSPEIAGAPVNQGSLRASERMRSETSWVQPNVSIGVENFMPNDSRRGKIP